MSIRPRLGVEVPELTARVARASNPAGTTAMWVRDRLDGLWADEDFAGWYPRDGRPGISPAQLATVSVLQFLLDLSDRDAAEAVRCRIDFKYALGLDLDDPGFHFSVLGDFRDRLLEDGRADRLLDLALARLKEAGLVRERTAQRTDSTHVLAAVRDLTRLELVTEAVRAALEELARTAGHALEGLVDDDWGRRYGRPVRLGKNPTRPKTRINDAGADARRLLEHLAARHPDLLLGPRVEALRQVLLQNYHWDASGRLRWRDDEGGSGLPPSAARIVSPYDLAARYSRRGQVTRWTGYLAHVTETCAEDGPNVITDGGPGYWLVLRHADVSHVSRSPMIFSSWQGTSFLRDPKPSDVAVLRRMMLNMDPPEHTKLRKIVNRAFTPQAIRRQLADSITRHARDVVDSVCELGKIDFLTDVAAEMPLRVLADVLGVPTEDRHLLYKWTNALVGLDDPEYGDPQAFLAAFVEMFSYARQRTAEKRARPGDDVWSTIVTAEVNGERLSDDDLDRFFQLLVIAGNDTTRNLIANTLLTLSSHPGQLARLRADLGLIPSAIEEVLRYAPSVIQFRRTATQDAELAGQQISAGDKVIINYASANRDEAVFADPDRFDIGRDPNPHISFGDGTHFCLGANLARLQARTLLGELFSRLPDITATGTPTRLRSSFMNGIKHLTAEFTPAPPRHAAAPAPGVAATDDGQRSAPATSPAQETASPGHGTPLLALYGSNFGTAEETAEQVAARAAQLGFGTNVAALDDHINDLPRDGAVAVVAATYNGTPPDNAVGFARWLTEDHPDLTGVSYVVFGCGNREWAATFQQFPQFIDEQMAALGARRLHARGEGDAAGDFDGQFEQWTTGLWPALAEAFQIDLGATAPESAAPRYRIEYVPGNRQSPFVETLGARPMRVRASRELTTPLDGAAAAHPVRHIELALPEDISYAAGDHLGVIPHNSESLVRRVAVRFGLDLDAHIRLHAEEAPGGFLPTGERITLRRLLADYVELLAVAGRRDIQTMLAHTEYPWTRTKLQALLDPAGDGRAYREDVLARRRSVLDLLEEHPTCRLPFPVYLQLLKPLAPRYYSISSSPRVDPAVASITVGALAGPAWAGRGRFEGVCSNYLCGQEAGQVIYAFVRDTSSSFRLPPDLTRPVIMIAAGTGIAPYRGFLAERAARAATGEQPGPGLLVFGCRHPQADLIYGDELAALANAAGIQLACAYSRVPDLPRVYVQDRLRELGEHVWPLLEDNAVIYVCGSTAMAGGVREALNDLHREHTGSDAGQAESWLAELGAQHRYLVDVWASG